jgi:hypothetical protein
VTKKQRVHPFFDRLPDTRLDDHVLRIKAHSTLGNAPAFDRAATGLRLTRTSRPCKSSARHHSRKNSLRCHLQRRLARYTPVWCARVAVGDAFSSAGALITK